MTLYGTRRALLRPRRRFVDTFDALLSRWQTVAGTLAVSGGALQASALGDWLNNLITNGESWTGGPPPTAWVEYNVSASVVDSAIDPGVTSPSENSTVVKLTKTGSTNADRLEQKLGSTGMWARLIKGASYHFGAWAYGDPGNTRKQGHTFFLDKYSGLADSGAWTLIESVTDPYNTQNTSFNMYVLGTTATGDIVYRDGAFVYRHNAAAIRNVAPAFRARLTHISPAAPSVVPAGWMFRYTGPLDYWELRVLPNTSGNDMQIVQVTAGAETVRAEADVGWTAEGTDEVELIVRGSTITTRYRKAGGVWTAGPSYASATQGAQARAMGPMLYGTTTARWARVEVDW